MTRFAVYIMVGPDPAEARRLRTVLASLFRHEPATPLLVIVNDSRRPLPDLVGIVPAGCEVIEIANTHRHVEPEHSRNILKALRLLAARDDWAMAFKLDADALVIAPFAEKVDAHLVANPRVGQVGQAGINCDGSPVDYRFYVKLARRFGRRIQVWRSPQWGFAQAWFGPRAKVRRLVRRAASNGLKDGRHCQGGGYAITRGAVAKLAAENLLDDDPAGDVMTSCDDLMLSTLVAAVGFEVASQTAPGQPFALCGTGLPMMPAALAANGYAIIHSVKNDPRVSEDEVVAYFENRVSVK